MDQFIYTKNVVLRVDNKTLPAIPIWEADKYLLQMVENLSDGIEMCVEVDLNFTDGFKYTESFKIKNSDSLIENIIQYHVIGKIRYKAGLMAYAAVDVDRYYDDLKDVDTEFFKNFYNKYSLFYGEKKISRLTSSSSIEAKLKNKYLKQIEKGHKKIAECQSNIVFLQGVIEGIDLVLQKKHEDIDYQKQLISLDKNCDEYQRVKGILHGCDVMDV